MKDKQTEIDQIQEQIIKKIQKLQKDNTESKILEKTYLQQIQDFEDQIGKLNNEHIQEITQLESKITHKEKSMETLNTSIETNHQSYLDALQKIKNQLDQ